MKVKVDRSTCTGCGLCVSTCPEVFDLDSDSIAIVKVTIVPKEVEESCHSAAEGCPVEAIKFEE